MNFFTVLLDGHPTSYPTYLQLLVHICSKIRNKPYFTKQLTNIPLHVYGHPQIFQEGLSVCVVGLKQFSTTSFIFEKCTEKVFVSKSIFSLVTRQPGPAIQDK